MNDVATTNEPLWLAIEGRILDLSSSDLAGDSQERTIHRIAQELDGSGYNVSHHAGNMLQLRGAVADRHEVGHPLLTDFNSTTGALTLDDVSDTLKAAVKIGCDLGSTWPRLKDFDRRADILGIVEQTKLDLLVAEAKGLSEDQGIRYLIGAEVASETILGALGIGEDRLAAVHAAIEQELAAIARVEELLQAVEDKPVEEKARHLVTNDVSDELIAEHAGIDQAVIDGVREAMQAELAEKKRLEEEAAARKKAEAEGPSLDSIPDDEMVEHIESIQEILEFSDQESEIRQMCEQSSIPKCLVDLAVTDPDKLEELLEAAEG